MPQVLNDSIGDDPAKEKLCIERAKLGLHRIVPFYIDTRYVASVRSQYPDATFIATDNGMLLECFRNEGSAKYGPSEFAGEPNFDHSVTVGRPRN
jgi:hypothetical protein